MAFPKSRILTTEQLVQLIRDSNRNGERFCFILGSGASVESGIPSGNKLEMWWMNCIMGKEPDDGTPPMNVDTMRELGEKLYNDNLIEHSFDEIETAWAEAVREKKPISSELYFDIYKLRFYPSRRNGYRYLERVMEGKQPSLGYHALAKFLTESNQNNLVITTNFDSLVEDALFLYTIKKPLVVSHESLAAYIESDIQRPIVAKVHRGLMYEPFNSPETTNRLLPEWREALNSAFRTYTPIVIGYAGGDRSLMSFMKEDTTIMPNGIYWCYREESGLPDKSIQRFIEKKDGYLVSIDGFDGLMTTLGISLYPKFISPSGTDHYLGQQYKRRSNDYTKQWEKLSKKAELAKIMQPVSQEELEEESLREAKGTLTARDHYQRGVRADNKKDFVKSIEEFSQAIEKDPDHAYAYNYRGCSYDELKKYDKAIEDYNRAIQLDPDYTYAYNNRGIAYDNLKQYDRAIQDYDRAILLDPNFACAYSNRGTAHANLKQYVQAIQDFDKSIQLDPNNSAAYYNRGNAYRKSGQHERAIQDYDKAIQLDPNYTRAYNNRGNAYDDLKQYEKAIEDYTTAIQQDSKVKIYYQNRARTYHRYGKPDLAKADEDTAASLE